MRIAHFSVLFGDYDNWVEPKYIQEAADYYLFTDQDIESDLYIVVPIESGDNPILTARTWKILKGYEYLCNLRYDLTIYTDTNIVQKKDIKPLIQLQITDLMILKHPLRKCIYEEFNACCEAAKDNIETMRKQVQGYADRGYPRNNGMVASGVMFRYNKKEVLKFCKAWLGEVENGSTRDQLSFNYIAWKMKYKVDLLHWNYLSEYFIYNSKHKKK